ncbi:MAG TPA: OmpA family protein [Stellaceae bacterium]|nr:OmpA family protein [Stellaceae bacterium]
MRGLAAIIRSAPRGLYPAAVLTLALAVSAAPPAWAQSAYIGHGTPDVVVNLSALDQLGPAPTVPDGRFVLHAPRVMTADQSWTGQKVVLRHPAAQHVAQRTNRIERIGAVTIDYSALPPASARFASAAPRIVLHLPGAQTVAASVPPSNPAPQGPADSAARPPLGNAIASAPPMPLPSPAPPPAPSMPQVAALPPSATGFSRLSPAAGPPDTSERPEPGAALAATHPMAFPAASPAAIPKSDSNAVRFAPGAADLGGDARAVLDAVVQKLGSQPNQRIQLVSYASAPGTGADDAVAARRTSLARAVVVRAYLIQRGVASTRIDVRALGNRVEGGGSLDRVDLVVLGS